MVAPLLTAQTGRVMAGPTATARPSGVEDTGFAAMLAMNHGAEAKATPPTEAPKAAVPAGPPALEALLGELENIAQDGLAQLVAAGTDPTAQAAAVSGMDAKLREAIAGFDEAQGTDLGGLLTIAPDAALGSEAGALNPTSVTFAVAPDAAVAQEAVQAVTSIASPAGLTASLTKISDLLGTVAAAVQGNTPSASATPVAAPTVVASETFTSQATPKPPAAIPTHAKAQPDGLQVPQTGSTAIADTAGPGVPAPMVRAGAASAPVEIEAQRATTVPATAADPWVKAGLPPSTQAGANPMGAHPLQQGRRTGEAMPTPSAAAVQEAETPLAASAVTQVAPDAAGDAETRAPLSFAAMLSKEAAQGGEGGAEATGPDLPMREILAAEPGAAPLRTAETAALPRIAPAPPPPPQPSGFSRALTSQIRETSIVEGRTRIALTPGGLGEIEIELSRDEGQLRVVIRAENQTVLQALRGDRDGLMTMLGQSGAGVEDGQLSFESFDRGGRDGAAPDERATGRPGATATAGPETALADDTPASPTGDGQLDILT